MAVRCHGKNNAELVRNLSGKAGIVKDPRVVAAMEMVDRGAYCQAHPYEDRPQRIGYNITISAPHMHAHALQELATNLVPGAKVLDVGCGSGYLTACFAELVRGSGGHAYGIDHISGLVELSETNMRRGNPSYLENGDASLFVADGFQGLPAHAPFDVIHVGAAAPTLPEALVAQLAPGGKLFIPVGPDGGSQVRSLLSLRMI
jgi:protein-L-isoaspartate(D-aspartate) O-methyltransferase